MFECEFYPTPKKVIEKMLARLKIDQIGSILEPSAGKGDIVNAIIEKHEAQLSRYSNAKLDIDTVEIDANLRHILKGKGYRVIHDDFLTLETHKRYSLIMLNPPFSAGDKHLLKALDMQKNGGKIVCLLNAETLRNPYTNIRKDLVHRLDEYGAEIEFMDGAFTGAERKTDVEIALVKVDIPRAEQESIIMEGLHQEERYRAEQHGPRALTHGEFIDRIVAQYNFEIRAGSTLINEYLAMKSLVQGSLKKNSYKGSILLLNVNESKVDGPAMINEFIEKVRYKYWEALFLSDEFTSLFTSKLLEQYMDKMNELKGYDFSVFNILQIKEEISRSLLRSVEETILALFDEFSYKHSWYNETSKNIHYYNGWKTNKAWRINKKVIIPNMHAWDDWSGKLRLQHNHGIIQKLADIEKVFNYLDGGLTDHVDLIETLKRAKEEGQSKKIQLKYFLASFFKKGTCHLEFTNMELLKKFNLFGSQRKGWLPPSYGKASYDDMAADEQGVVDDFEGREEYEKVLQRRDYYLYKSTELLRLGA